MQDAATFGRFLKTKRRQQDLTQEELAQRAQCAAETIRKVEAGSRRASKSLAQHLADALQLEGDERTHFLHLARSEAVPEESKQEVAEQAPEHTAAPLLATKLYLPRPRGRIVDRPRLLLRLDACQHNPLTLIAAPAGFGKTTLLAAWIHQPTATPRRVAWLALNTSDSDPTQFLRYLISALQTLASEIGATVLPLLRSAQPPPLQPLLALLVNDLSQAPEGSLLVLDDYHVIESPAVHEMLTFLLDHLPPQLHLVIASRVNPPLPLARMRVRGQLGELRATDLRFTTDEAASFLHEVMGLPLSATDVAAVEARTEGWIAGLQLAALSLQELPPEQISAFIDSFTGSHRFVVDYLVDEVLAGQPQHIQRFLLKTSLLDHLCGPLCAAVVGMERSACQELLEHLERANLFMVPLDEERRWYRYHHLFAQVLNERLLRGTTQEEVATLHRHAAVWFEQQGFAVEAVQHALVAQEWEHAARLVELHGWPMLLQGQSQMVRGWLKLLPENLLRTRPYLLELQAALFFGTNELEAAERKIAAAEAAIVENGLNDLSHPLFAYMSMMRANIARARGDISTCVELSRHVLALLSPLELIRRSVSMLGMALIFRVSGDVGPTNAQLVANAIDATRNAGNLPTLFNAVVAMAELRWMQGKLRQAVATYRTASDVAPKLLALPALNNGASFYCGLGGLLYEWNQIESSEENLVHGVGLIRGGLQTHGDVVTNGYITLARLQQLRGNVVEAMTTLRELQMLARKWNYAPYLHARADAAVAYLALQQKDLKAAVEWADSKRWQPGDELDYRREQEWLTLARIRIVHHRQNPSTSQLNDVLRLLDRLLSSAESHQRIDSVIHILLLAALAMHAQGDSGAAIDALVRALRLASPEGYVRLFVDEGRLLADLLAKVSRLDQVEPSLRRYAEMLLSVLNEQESGETTTVAPARLAGKAARGESLTPRELEVLHLLAVGRSNQAIAQELVVEIGTVKRHVSNIMDKLQVQSRLEAVTRARNLGIV